MGEGFGPARGRRGPAGPQGNQGEQGPAGATPFPFGGETHGDLLYRAASTWQRLAAGAVGSVLKSLGAGAAPVWVKPYFGTVTGTTSAPVQTANAYAYPGEVLEQMTLTGTFAGSGPTTITFRGTFALQSTILNSDGVEVTIYIDGVELDAKYRQGFQVSGLAMTLGNVHLTTGALVTLSAGEHTVAVLWRRTGTQANVAAVLNQRQLIVVEAAA